MMIEVQILIEFKKVFQILPKIQKVNPFTII